MIDNDSFKVIDNNGRFDVARGEVHVYDSLPAGPKDGTYRIRQDNMGALYLAVTEPLAPPARDVSGDVDRRVGKVFSRFLSIDGSMGVLMSGARGIGKTTLVKALARECYNRGIPVIIMDKYYPGMAEYIMRIDCVCMCVFDEFEKMFDSVDQAHLLTVFDGLNSTKHLNVVTCNEPVLLDENMLDRPGRFFYHFKFDYPDSDQITEFLRARNVTDDETIDEVVRFAQMKSLTYDMLDAIAAELAGTDLQLGDVIDELNIDVSNSNRMAILVNWSDGGWSTAYFSASLIHGDSTFEEEDNEHDVIIRLTDLTTELMPMRPSPGDGMVLDHDSDVNPYSDSTAYNEYDTTLEFDMADLTGPKSRSGERQLTRWYIDCNGVRLKHLYACDDNRDLIKPLRPVSIKSIRVRPVIERNNRRTMVF